MLWKISSIRIIYLLTYTMKAFFRIWYFQQFKSFHNKDDEEKAKEQLAIQLAEQYKKMATRLQGMTIKVGQFLSTRIDILPEVFIKPLETLTENASPLPWKTVERILLKELGGHFLQQVEVEKDPIAAASIAVVHKAIHQNGDQLALKIQRPDIPKIIRADLRAIKIIMFFAKKYRFTSSWVDWKRLYLEVEKIILQELDFRKEIQFAKSFLPLNDRFQIRVPRYEHERSTSKVILMEWLDTMPINDLSFMEVNRINPEQVILRLVRGYLWQIQKGTYFHADPHSGNIRMMQDGTIVFFDFGMVGAIDQASQVHIVRLITAIITRNQKRMIEELDALGFIRSGADLKDLEAALDDMMTYFLEHRAELWNEQMINRVLEQFRYFVNKQPIQLPAEFAFFGRAMGMLIGLISHLERDVDYIQLGRKILPDLKKSADWLPFDLGSTTLNRFVKTIFQIVEEMKVIMHDEVKTERTFEEKIKPFEVKLEGLEDGYRLTIRGDQEEVKQQRRMGASLIQFAKHAEKAGWPLPWVIKVLIRFWSKYK
jgi:predicted unusual protein kinase regulating ubiquinone biosynthesis (AarF/ABC1/UbiB family)